MPRHADPIRRAALRAALAVSTLGTAGALASGCTVDTQTDEMFVADSGDDATGDASSDARETTGDDTRVPDADDDTGAPPTDVAIDTMSPSDTGVPPDVSTDTAVPPTDVALDVDGGNDTSDGDVTDADTLDADDTADMVDAGDTTTDTADVVEMCSAYFDGVCPESCDPCFDADCCEKQGYTAHVDSLGWCSEPSCFDEVCCDEANGVWTEQPSLYCDGVGCPVPGPFMPPTVRV